MITFKISQNLLILKIMKKIINKVIAIILAIFTFCMPLDFDGKVLAALLGTPSNVDFNLTADNTSGGVKLTWSAGPTDTTKYKVYRRSHISSGSLSGQADVTSPPNSLLIAGSTDNNVANYTFNATGEDFIVNKLTIINDPSGAFDTPIATSAVAQVKLGCLDHLGAPAVYNGSLTSGSATLSGLDCKITAGVPATFSVKADVSGMMDVGEGLSGMGFRLGIRDNSNDASTFTAVGQTSLVAENAVSITDPSNVNSFVVRKSMPTFAKVSGLTTTLVNGQNRLYGLRITADNAGSVEFGRLVFNIVSTGLGNHGTEQVNTFKIFRNSTLLDTKIEIYCTDVSGNHATSAKSTAGLDECDGTASDGIADGTYKVIVSFNQEETIGAGQTFNYYLDATVNGRDLLDSLQTSLSSGDVATPLTGLTLDTSSNTGKIYVSGGATSGIFTASATDFSRLLGTADNIIWSDNSADVHLYPTVTTGSVTTDTGSYDWTNGNLIPVPSSLTLEASANSNWVAKVGNKIWRQSVEFAHAIRPPRMLSASLNYIKNVKFPLSKAFATVDAFTEIGETTSINFVDITGAISEHYDYIIEALDDSNVVKGYSNIALNTLYQNTPIVISSVVTHDTNHDGTVDQITLTFSESVDIVDGNADNGLSSITLNSGCSIANGNYASSGVTTKNLTLTGCTAGSTSITPTISYAEVANCTTPGAICKAGGLIQMSNYSVIATDGVAPLITATAPVSSSTVNDTKVSYHLSEAVASGSIEWIQTGGVADPGSPHNQTLAGAELGSGSHSGITLSNDPTLVSGAIYSIKFDVTDSSGNPATQVISTSVTYATNTQCTSTTNGQAELPSGTTSVMLTDSTKLDVSPKMETATGGNITVGGSIIPLNNYTSGNLTGVDLSVPSTVGGATVTVDKAVKLFSGTSGTPISLSNINFSTSTLSIPDGTAILGPVAWDGTVTPPKAGSTSGTDPSGFTVGSTVVEVGSPDGILLFDKPASVIIDGIQPYVGYRPAGSTVWSRITQTCAGTYANPTAPVFPGECFVTDLGTNKTKIYTWHLTTFGNLNVVQQPTQTQTVSNSGGGGGGRSLPPPPVSSNTQTSSTSSVIASVVDNSSTFSRPLFILSNLIKVNALELTKTVTLTTEKGSITLQPNPKATISVLIPENTSVIAPSDWDGRINPPLIQTAPKVSASGDKIENSTEKLTRDNVLLVVKMGSDKVTLNFSNKVTLKIPVEGMDEGAKMAIYLSSSAHQWTYEGDAVVKNSEVVFEVNHFSYFALGKIGTAKKMVQFTDIANHWAETFIQSLADKGIVSGRGEGKFAPDDQITRAELVKIAVATFGIPVSKSVTEKSFDDVETDAWYAPYIAVAKEADIVQSSEKNFRPNDLITRVEALKILIEAGQFAGVQEDYETNYANKPGYWYVAFKDAPMDAWFAKYIAFAKDNEIVGGKSDGLFYPADPMTRAEVAKVILKVLGLKGK
jgi:hypothetical protein